MRNRPRGVGVALAPVETGTDIIMRPFSHAVSRWFAKLTSIHFPLRAAAASPADAAEWLSIAAPNNTHAIKKRLHMSNSIVRRLLLWGFDQLYTRFAWAYDAVAALASLSEWQQWGRAVMPFTRGERVLEIAHGTGHLYATLQAQGWRVVAMDRSWAMARLLQRRNQHRAAQTCADARHLPFPDAYFDSAVTTFPAPFIFEPEVMAEVHRVLRSGGRWVILPAVIWRADQPLTRALRWAHRLSGDRRDPRAALQLFAKSGFACEMHLQPAGRADAIIWVCVKATAMPLG